METQQVDYTYNWGWDNFSPDVSKGNGSLVQIRRRVLMDDGDPAGVTGAPGFIHNTKITQYRYHTGPSTSGGVEDDFDTVGTGHGPSGDGRFDLGSELDANGAGPLKMVIEHASFERMAQAISTRQGVTGDSNLAVEEAAWRCLILPDHTEPETPHEDVPAYFEGLTNSKPVYVVDMASKIIGYGDTGTAEKGLVIDQYLQGPGCGCAGSDGFRHFKYAYETFSTSGNFWRSTRISEYIDDGSSGEVLYRDEYFDLHSPVSFGQLQQRYHAVIEYDSYGTTEKSTWVTEYIRDDRFELSSWTNRRGNLLAVIPPGSMEGSTYDPLTSTSAPDCDRREGEGLYARCYDWTADGLLAGVRITLVDDIEPGDLSQLGLNDAMPGTLIRSMSYGDTNEPSRVTKAEWYTTGSPTADTTRTIWYKYRSEGGNHVTHIERYVEVPTSGEGGPATGEGNAVTEPVSGSSNLAYKTVHGYNANGDVVAIRTADGQIKYYERDATTGVITNIHEDYGSTSITLYSTVTFGESASASLLVPIEREFVPDDLGRIIEYTTPVTMENTIASGDHVKRRTARGYRSLGDLKKADGTTVMLPNVTPVFGASYTCVLALPAFDDDNDAFEGPARATWMYRDGRPLAIAEFTLGLDGISGDPHASTVDPFEDLLENADTELVGLIAFDYDRSNNRTAKWVWRDIESDTYDTTTYEYDSVGRLAWTQDPTGERVGVGRYDGMDRPVTFLRATEATSSTPIRTRVIMRDSDSYTSGENVPGADGGNGWVTKTIDHVSDSVDRTTEYQRDGRGRVIQVVNPAAPHQVVEYNNLDEPTAAAEFGVALVGTNRVPDSSSSADDRSAFVKLDYNQRGRVYSVETAFDPEASSPSAFNESRTWFDAMGRVIAEASTGSPVTKLEYDILGRQTAGYITDIGSDPLVMSYAEASNTAGDTVLEQSEQAYSAAGLPLLSTTTILGGLTPSDVIKTYTGAYFDSIGRPIASANFGTNDSSGEFKGGATAPTWPPSAAPSTAGTGDEIVTEIEYDARGRVDQVVDPEGVRTKLWYDDSGRRIATTENFTVTTGSGATVFTGYDSGYGYPLFNNLFQSDDERTTGFTYDGAGRITHRVAYLPSNSYQVTEYEYGVQDESDEYGTLRHDSLPNSLITSNSLLSRVIYPDETTGFPDDSDGTAQKIMAYNRQGEVIGIQDQLNNVHEFTRDTLGRVTKDEVLAFGTDVDDAVDAIETSFDAYGRVESVSSKSGTTTLNEVEFVYTPSGLIEEFIQEAEGAVDASSPRVTYDYEDGESSEGNSGRIKTVTYPTIDTGLASTLSMYYGASNSIDDRISRLLGLDSPSLTGSSDELVRYDYLGLATPIKTSYPIPGVSLDRALAGDGSTTAGEFPGFDAFGRVARHTWADDSIAQGTGGNPTIPPIIDRILGYSKSSELTHDLDGRPAASGASRDRVYEHDDLHRLVEANLGATIGLDPTNLTAGPFSEEWELDTLGNWTSYGEDTDGDGSLNLFDSEYNSVNEVDHRYTGANRRYEFVYDDNGNMTEIGRRMGASSPYAYANHSEYVYDAWNRLVEAKRPDSSGLSMLTVGEYEYNGIGHRVRKRADTSTTAANGLDEERTYFYTPGWQLIEERIDVDDDLSNGNTGHDDTVNRIAQQFWGSRYIDDAVARRTDNDADGDFTDAGDGLFFYLTDRQFSVNALVRADGDVVERIEYSPYGLARRIEDPTTGDLGQQLHGYNEDVDGDGQVDGDDAQEILDILPSNFLSGGSVPMSDPDYEARLDLNKDGKIDFYGDYGPAYNNNGLSSPPTGWISDPKMPLQDGAAGPDNPIGYTGHVFDPETGFYLARHRHYSPEFGRWVQRDPAGYIDGSSLYESVASKPLTRTDPMGLCSEDGTRASRILQAMIDRGCFDEIQDLESAVPGILSDAFGELSSEDHIPGILADVGIATGTRGAAASSQVMTYLILYSDSPTDISDFIRDVVRRGRRAENIRKMGRRFGYVVGIGFVAYDVYEAGRDGGDGLEMAGAAGTGTSSLIFGAMAGGAAAGAVGGPLGVVVGVGTGIVISVAIPAASDLLAHTVGGVKTPGQEAAAALAETCNWLYEEFIKAGGTSSAK
jgi:RHS repeat-associated protein